tara:strand:+ start:10820 stop:11425 length:606 start_codon:yes stop_codon:yes gene_type:complete
VKKDPLSTRKIFPSSQVPPSSYLSIGIFILIFIGFIIFMNYKTSSQEENLLNMNSRLIDLEEQIMKSVESSEVTIDTLSDDLKDANREIRKLWDLSNKRNKKRINALEETLSTLNESSQKFFEESQEAKLISKELAKAISDVKSRVAKIAVEDLSTTEFNKRIAELEEAIKSFDSYRKQTNQALLKLRESLEKSNSLPTPD